MKPAIVFSGSVAQKPGQGGHAWVFLQYILGFRKLGWDVLFLDRLEREMCVDTSGRRCGIDESYNLRFFLGTMAAFGLDDSYSLACDGGVRTIGIPRDQVVERARNAALLLNVMGFLRDEEVLERIENRVFLDIDPGFGQMWQELDLHSMFAGHLHYVTIGQNIGHPGCGIPDCGLAWITTPQPVVLDWWPAAEAPPSRPFTTIASWRGAYGPIPFRGKTYGLRVHEFRRFAGLPKLTGRAFELAMNLDPADERDRQMLIENGWSLIDPRCVASDPWTYRSYVQESMGEFMAAKNMYVDTASGWFSDRSICYLASGRPVIAQDTCLARLHPLGQGLLTYRTLDEAAEAVREVEGNYARHARAARAVAEECFESGKVLSRLLEKVGAA